MRQLLEASEPQALALLRNPQHIMNLMQGVFQGFIPTPARGVIIPPRNASEVELQILRATAECFLKLNRGVSFTWISARLLGESITTRLVLERYLDRDEIHRLVAGLPVLDSVVMMTRSKGIQLVLLDDGFGSTYVSSLLPVRSHVTSRIGLCRKTPPPDFLDDPRVKLYTAFSGADKVYQVERHDYSALRAALTSPASVQEPPMVFFVDTAFDVFSQELHFEYLKEVFRNFPWQVYVPHRRSSPAILEFARDALGTDVLETRLPVELALAKLSGSGRVLFSATSSVYLARYFVPASSWPNLTYIDAQSWLREFVEGKSGEVTAKGRMMLGHVQDFGEALETHFPEVTVAELSPRLP